MSDQKEEKTKPILVPPITDELLKENEENQKLWANWFIFKSPGVDDHAARVINSNLELLKELNNAIRRKNADVENLKPRIAALRDDTAIWLSSIGDFKKAAEIASDKAHRTLYRSYQTALERKDEEFCEHPRWIKTENSISQNIYREFDFFSPLHGRKLSMIRCNTCGFRNARELDADLDKLSRHREAVRANSENLSKAEIEKKLSAEHLSTNLNKILR